MKQTEVYLLETRDHLEKFFQADGRLLAITDSVHPTAGMAYHLQLTLLVGLDFAHIDRICYQCNVGYYLVVSDNRLVLTIGSHQLVAIYVALFAR